MRHFPSRYTHSYDSGKTLAEQLSYLHYPCPFKNPNYAKNINRRAKNLKAVLAQERERERAEREKRRAKKEGMKMDVDGAIMAVGIRNKKQMKKRISPYVRG